MEPQNQYAKTSDGVRIAFTTQGQGRPLIVMAGPGSSSHVESGSPGIGNPKMRAQREGLSRNRMLVSMDLRGQGMSAHGVSDYSLDAFLRDIDAVVERLGADSGKGFFFADRGEFEAKGFEKPVRISEVNWQIGD